MRIGKIPSYIHRFIMQPGFRFVVFNNLGFYNHWDDERYLKKAFKIAMGKELNLESPKTFNEKLQWLKIHDRKPEYTMMVDKYKVREYIAKQLGEEYLIPLIGVWDKAEDIDFNVLPNRFVLKCNHNSGLGMYICKDKSKLSKRDIKRIKCNLNKGLKQDYYLTGREWPYKDVPRKIICEQYMEDNPTRPVIFSGTMKCTFACTRRSGDHDFRVTFYFTDWKKMPFEKYYPAGSQMAKTASYDEMIELAERLAEKLSFARIDFYESTGKPYFGEITFPPGAGMEEFAPEEWDYPLVSWIKLPENAGGYLLISNKVCLHLPDVKSINAEMNLSQSEHDAGLFDYKVHVFNGEAKFVLVCSDRFSPSGVKEDFFDLNWNHLDVKRPNIPQSNADIPRPANLEKMLTFAEKLGAEIPFVRVDFYEAEGLLKFGEITFYPASGMEEFDPAGYDLKLGNQIVLWGGQLKNDTASTYSQTDKNASGLTDYKFFCFDGFVDCVMVCTERDSGEPKFFFFDKNWRLLRLNIRGRNAPENFTLPKPCCIDRMFSIAERLSKGKPFVRVDLYECAGQVYFGELTFFPASGFDPNLLGETDSRFGALIDLEHEGGVK